MVRLVMIIELIDMRMICFGLRQLLRWLVVIVEMLVMRFVVILKMMMFCVLKWNIVVLMIVLNVNMFFSLLWKMVLVSRYQKVGWVLVLWQRLMMFFISSGYDVKKFILCLGWLRDGFGMFRKIGMLKMMVYIVQLIVMRWQVSLLLVGMLNQLNVLSMIMIISVMMLLRQLNFQLRFEIWLMFLGVVMLISMVFEFMVVIFWNIVVVEIRVMFNQNRFGVGFMNQRLSMQRIRVLVLILSYSFCCLVVFVCWFSMGVSSRMLKVVIVDFSFRLEVRLVFVVSCMGLFFVRVVILVGRKDLFMRQSVVNMNVRMMVLNGCVVQFYRVYEQICFFGVGVLLCRLRLMMVIVLLFVVVMGLGMVLCFLVLFMFEVWLCWVNGW